MSSEKKVSMADFGALLDAQLNTYRKGFNPGDRVTGTVTDITHQYVTLDVHAKHEGLLPTEDVLLADGSMKVAIGDTLEVIFSGMLRDAFLFTVSLSESRPSVDRSLQEAFEKQMPIEGRVEKEINGGYEVTVGGQRAFCPFSQINLFRQEGATYTDQKFNFLVTECSVDDRGVNVIVSRRALMEKEREAQRQELVEDLYEGEVVTGKVTRLMDFGVFVDLGGVEGLIPMKELAWARGVKAEDLVKPGDSVDVVIKQLDWARNRISLSLKATQPDPWNDAVAQFPVGRRFPAKVANIQPFGAFVTIVPGVEGLIAISKFNTGKRINSPREVVTEGQDVLVQVDAIDFERRRFSLSMVNEAAEGEAAARLEEAHDVADWLAENKKAGKSFSTLGDALSGLKF